MQLNFCKYHRREEPLCKTHILPNAFYRHLRNREADGFWVNEVGTKKIKRIPGGLYDASILCSAADHEMGRYDEYEVSVFKEERPGSIFIDGAGREWARIENLNVGLMNLFLLSCVWRCHHAQIEPFKDFEVGTIYEERIRQKLLRKDADPARWFSYVITMLYGDVDDTILPLKFPFKKKSMEKILFSFIFSISKSY